MALGFGSVDRLIPRIPFLTDRRIVSPEVRYTINGLNNARNIIRENEILFSSIPFISHSPGSSSLSIYQNDVPDRKYGTRAANYKWDFYFIGAGAKSEFTLSVLTLARHPDTMHILPVLPEVKIRMPLSEKEIDSKQFISLGEGMGICIGLRLPDGSLKKYDGGGPKNLQQSQKSAHFIVDEFIAYLSSLLPKRNAV